MNITTFIGGGYREMLGKEKEEVCQYCLGTGWVSTDETDSDGNIERGVGRAKCICQLGEEADFSGSSNEDR